MAEKVTVMFLEVDLQCEKCYKKVKKVLCKFPQIRDQVYDEKNNTVIIKVVCCSPEKIRDKLCCKGGGVIKRIEIREPEKPKPPEPKKEPEKPKPAPAEKPKEPEKRKEPEKAPPKPAEPEKKKEPEKPKEAPAPEQPKQAPPKAPEPDPVKPQPVPVPSYPVQPVYPIGICCVPCYEGRPGGPCFHGHGGPPPYYHGGYYGKPVYDSYGGGGPCYVSRCEYFTEESPSSCTIM